MYKFSIMPIQVELYNLYFPTAYFIFQCDGLSEFYPVNK